MKGVNYRIIDRAYTAGQYSYQLFIESASGKLAFMTSANGTAYATLYDGDTIFKPNTWYHVVATSDGSTKRTYINGVYETSVAWANDIFQGTDSTAIGSIGAGGGNYFPGSLSDVRIYNRALTAEEIKDLYGSYNPVVKASSLTKGLVGRWGLGSSEGGTGSTTFDMTPNANNGTRYGETALASIYTTDRHSQSNKAMTFNGSDDYVDLSNVNIIGSDTTYTIAAWVKRSAGAGGSIYGEYYSASGYTRHFFTISSNGFYTLDEYPPSGSGGGVYGTTIIPENTWTHIVAVVDGGTESFYFNGNADGSGSSETYASEAPNKAGIGGRALDSQPGGWYGYFNGSISDIRIYNRALSATEVKMLYEGY